MDRDRVGDRLADIRRGVRHDDLGGDVGRRSDIDRRGVIVVGWIRVERIGVDGRRVQGRSGRADLGGDLKACVRAAGDRADRPDAAGIAAAPVVADVREAGRQEVAHGDSLGAVRAGIDDGQRERDVVEVVGRRVVDRLGDREVGGGNDERRAVGVVGEVRVEGRGRYRDGHRDRPGARDRDEDMERRGRPARQGPEGPRPRRRVIGPAGVIAEPCQPARDDRGEDGGLGVLRAGIGGRDRQLDGVADIRRVVGRD